MSKEITDTTDFANTKLPDFAQLDFLLRCHICKDFLKTPVLTPCGHTFCSVCIREYLQSNSKCPLCLLELRESMLRSEFLVNGIVQTYQSLRPSLIDILDSTRSSNDTSIIELGSDSEGDSYVKEPIDITGEYDDDLQIVGASNKRTSLRSKSAIYPSSTPKTMNRIGKSSSSIQSMFKPTTKNKNLKEKQAQCPVCEGFFPIQVLERVHLDECLTLQSLGKKRKGTTSSLNDQTVSNSLRTSRMNANTSKRSQERRLVTPTPPPPLPPAISYAEQYLNSGRGTDSEQRLPKLDFSNMTTTKIKQKLSSLGLSTTGTKQNMIARYNHYEILWNSNFCDSLNPVDESELRRQLISWDAAHNVPASSSNGNNGGGIISKMMVNRNGNSKENHYKKLLADFKNDKFERKTWIRLYKQEFKLLIKEAKEKMIKKDAKKMTAEKEAALTTDLSVVNDLGDNLSDPDLSKELNVQHTPVQESTTEENG
ncbi:E3 ubiquitin-protein ligase RAD18 NDAI_0I00400 [Naumovozyma dairenensis CBS 421]|uniref:Postreplication repair E3 ubiquitin-protein ligase RAD18 n=1 Tax=Naumovozyma dairenensis (strain ATCC 10597 / BCRC 20456 / CBS 421 / NBRC 0211 / NRRL Y-12639) TaxID=1071378 RepID=G0WFP8_NAUDC|nr:hypothetical protein NDAI_0I00400 [Naumovozyma dairenensis CBS 421]CCD26609.1 hypothetical protein NDAI_0I00400 [Naumovozyma dairenensis CBS 421]